MSKNLELKIKLTGDNKGLVGAVKVTKKAIDGLGNSSATAGRKQKTLSDGMHRSSQSANLMGTAVKRAHGYLLAYIGAATIGSLIKSADKWHQLQIRIKTATKATGDYAQVSAELINITKQNGAELSSSVALFQSLTRASEELGASNDDMLDLTSTIQQLGVIGGTATANMQAGILQFSQAMSAGIVRAEEMNSLLENIPEVASRIARGLNLTTGELRKAVIEGKILSKDVFDALLAQAPEIALEFKEIPLTLDRASTKLGTSFDHFLGQLDEASGTTAILASMFDGIATTLDKITADDRGEVITVSHEDIKARNTELKEEISLLEKRNSVITQKPVNERTGQANLELSRNLREIKILKQDIISLDEYSDDIAFDKYENDVKGTYKVSAALVAALGQQQKMLDEQWNAEVEADVRENAAQKNQLAYKEALAEKEKSRLKLLDDAKDRQAAYNTILEQGHDITLSVMTAEEQHERQLDKLFDLYGQGAITLETFNRAEKLYLKELSQNTQDAMSLIESASTSAAKAFEDDWVKSIRNGELNFKSFADNIIEQIIRMQYQATIGKAVTSGLQSLFTQAVPAITGTSATATTAASRTSIPSVAPKAIANLAGRSSSTNTSSSNVVQITQHNDFSNVSPIDEAKIQNMLDQNSKQTEARIYQQIERGGSVSKRVGRR